MYIEYIYSKCGNYSTAENIGIEKYARVQVEST